MAKIGRWRILRFFGRYSYGLYMYHGLLFIFLVRLVHPVQHLVHSNVAGGILVITASLGITLGISLLSYHFFEAPILRLKARFN